MGRWIDCATLAQAKGLEGGLVCRAAAGLPFLLREGARCALVPPQLDAPRDVTVASVRPGSRPGEAVVRFEEVGDLPTAERLAGCHCLLRADQAEELAAGAHAAPALAALRWEGYEVRDAQAGAVGTVEAVEEGSAQARLVVARPGGSSVLVPLVEEIVLGADDDERVVSVALPAGLLDL